MNRFHVVCVAALLLCIGDAWSPAFVSNRGRYIGRVDTRCRAGRKGAMHRKKLKESSPMPSEPTSSPPTHMSSQAPPQLKSPSTTLEPLLQSKVQPSREDNPVDGYKIYTLPALYDLAFGYRNYESEVEFLVNAHRKHSSSASLPSTETSRDEDESYSILELAAGPARHCITALTDPAVPVSFCHAVDLCPEMASYARSLMEESEEFVYSVTDMRTLNDLKTTTTTTSAHSNASSSSLFNSAWMLLGSMQHLLTVDDALSTLRAVGAVVVPGGTLILELPHPAELFGLVASTRNGWEVPLEGTSQENEGELRVLWGDEGDEFDSVTQVRLFTVELELVGADGEVLQHVSDVVPTRTYTAQELHALAAASGCWEVTRMYGALDEEVPIEDEDLAFRMVCVMRRV